MKKLLLQKYLKYILSVCMVWAALGNVFLLGVSLGKTEPDALGELLKCIFDSRKYTYDFYTRQFWFVGLFMFYAAVYMVVFLFMQHETHSYRCMKLYRYGKKKYLKNCEKKALKGCMYAVMLVCAGIFAIIQVENCMGKSVRFENGNIYIALTMFVKMFLCMQLYGKITVYEMIKKDSSYTAFLMLFILFLHQTAEMNTNKIHFLIYAEAKQNLFCIFILTGLNILAEFIIRRKIKKIDLY